MFTGIIEELGSVTALDVADGHARLVVACETVVSDAAIGDSIAVNGCCLTVSAWPEDGSGFVAELMAETLRATALGSLDVGTTVNLERAMASGDRFGGHLVQGHVDGMGEVVARDEQPGTVFLTLRAPADVAAYLVPKGSVTIDGTSLTVVDVTDADDGSATFRVGLIPHTLEVTTFGSRSVGDAVNLEADVIAKYVERMLAPYGERMLAAGTATPYRAEERT